MSTSVPEFSLTPELFRCCSESLPDPMLLVSAVDACAYAANKAARKLFGTNWQVGCSLMNLTENTPRQLQSWLKMSSRSSQTLPASLMLKHQEQSSKTWQFEASLMQPATATTPPYVLLRADLHKHRSNGFVALNKEIEKQKKALQRLEDTQVQLESKNAALQRINEAFEKSLNERRQIELTNKHLLSENIRMSAELSVTRQLQKMVLPREDELKKITALDIVGFMEPASEVGGDYYDVLQYRDRVKIGIGDVTGHGLASGVLMLMVQTAVRTLLSSNIDDPKQFMDILNQAIYENVQRMQSDKNLTLSLLDYKDGRLKLCGQHEEVLVVRNGQVERIDTIDLGFMLGLEPDISQFVTHREIELNPGDGIVLYTDGLTEARNSCKQLYGLDRLCQVIEQYWSFSSKMIQTAIIGDLKNYIGSTELLDDVTLLVIKQMPQAA